MIGKFVMVQMSFKNKSSQENSIERPIEVVLKNIHKNITRNFCEPVIARIKLTDFLT
jgi:hypothetical protein